MHEKSAFRLWVENFWYHNKWKTIFVLFILSVILICVMQMGTVRNFDAQVLYAGPHIFTAEEKAVVESAFSQILSTDYNGDGLKNCQLADLTIYSNEQLTEILKKVEDPAELLRYNQYSEDARLQSFTQEITAGENVICLLDPHWYEIIKERNGLVEWSALFGETPENAIDGYGIPLKSTAFGQYFEVFDTLPDDTILCLRILSASMMFSQNKEAQVRHEQHQKIMKDLYSFSLPDGFVPRTEAVSESAPAGKKSEIE